MFLAMAGKWELVGSSFVVCPEPRTPLWPPLSSPVPPHSLSILPRFSAPRALRVACNLLSFFLPAVKVSSLPRIGSKMCQEPSTVLGASMMKSIRSPVPVLHSSSGERGTETCKQFPSVFWEPDTLSVRGPLASAVSSLFPTGMVTMANFY